MADFAKSDSTGCRHKEVASLRPPQPKSRPSVDSSTQGTEASLLSLFTLFPIIGNQFRQFKVLTCSLFPPLRGNR